MNKVPVNQMVPLGGKSLHLEITEKTCSSDVCSLKAAPPRRLLLFLKYASGLLFLKYASGPARGPCPPQGAPYPVISPGSNQGQHAGISPAMFTDSYSNLNPYITFVRCLESQEPGAIRPPPPHWPPCSACLRRASEWTALLQAENAFIDFEIIMHSWKL